jgi:hypothetical protein
MVAAGSWKKEPRQFSSLELGPRPRGDSEAPRLPQALTQMASRSVIQLTGLALSYVLGSGRFTRAGGGLINRSPGSTASRHSASGQMQAKLHKSLAN